jgi:hypothetical protein
LDSIVHTVLLFICSKIFTILEISETNINKRYALMTDKNAPKVCCQPAIYNWQM